MSCNDRKDTVTSISYLHYLMLRLEQLKDPLTVRLISIELMTLEYHMYNKYH